MKIEIEDIKNLANQNNLSFTNEELKIFKGEFEKILAFVGQVADTKIEGDVEESASRTLAELRADEVSPSFTNGQVLSNAPRKRDGCFVVPQVVE